MKFQTKSIEPFVFGETGIIYSKDDAARALKENSYYFIVAGFILLLALIAMTIFNTEIPNYSTKLILLFCIFHFVIGYSIRNFKSRVASLFALINSCGIILARVLDNDIGGTFVIALLFLAVSYRCIKASFFYHKEESLV